MVRPGARQRRLGQNFLRDPNLLDAIVRDAEVGRDDVVLEIGGGEGALTERLAPAVRQVHVVELDERLRPALDSLAAEAGNVSLHWGDAMRLDLAALDPAPGAVVSNLPYSVATPVILRTIEELASVTRWTVMVQLEIAERLAAPPGSRVYGSPSVLAQLACEVELVRRVDRAVFSPRPRVDSAILRLRRRGPAPDADLAQLVRGAFAHRRKTAVGSLVLADSDLSRDRVVAAFEASEIDPGARAEALAPGDFLRLAQNLRR
jgi:16S rRNA (adenine1518-N6/adenine1519-N6)-dimethyltransferase